MTTVRRAGTASATVLLGLVLTLGLAHAAAPEWTQWSGLAIWDVHELRENLRAQSEKREMLQSQQELLHSQIETVDYLATRLAAGSLTLSEAAAQCEPVVRDRPGFVTVLSLHYKTTSFQLMVCRHLIDRVSRLLPANATRRQAVLNRLEAECAALN